MRVIERRVSARWVLAGVRMEEKSAGERWRKIVGGPRVWRLAQRPRRIVASRQHGRMKPFPEGLSVGGRLVVATPAGHGSLGKLRPEPRHNPSLLHGNGCEDAN